MPETNTTELGKLRRRRKATLTVLICVASAVVVLYVTPYLWLRSTCIENDGCIVISLADPCDRALYWLYQPMLKIDHWLTGAWVHICDG